MNDLEESMRALAKAKRRKKELKTQIRALYEEYKLVKTEIKEYQERIEKWISSREYSGFVDTIKLEAPLKFPLPSDRKNHNRENQGG